ncbi:MAG: hypothetical protein SGPRY_011372, partial [Prymnesium sp.]
LYTTGCLALSVELLGGGHIAGSPFAVRVHAGPIQPERCTASGRGARECTVGRPSEFVIHPRDRWGNARMGSDYLRVDEEGQIVVEYTLLSVGDHTITISCCGMPICGSPFHLLCHAGVFDPSASSLLELTAEQIETGQPLRPASASAP